jgi:alpha-glucosidase
MRAHDLYPEINVKQQEAEKGSVLSFWKELLRMRKTYRDLFIHGAFEVLDREDPATFCFLKSRDDREALTILNFTAQSQPFNLAEKTSGMKLLVGNYGASEFETLKPFEGRIYIK